MPLRLAFESIGVGPPVVILHGVLGSSRNWRVIANALAGRHRILCVDMRNHGHSPWASSMEYAEMADDVRMLIDTEKLERPVIIGHGMGGKIAMALALLHPPSVDRLVVVDIAPTSYADRLTPYFEAMRGVDIRNAEQRAQALQRMVEKMPDSAAVNFLRQFAAIPEEHFDERLNLTALAAAVPSLCDFPPELLLRRYEGESSLIHGALSDRVSAAELARIIDPFPKMRAVEIAGAGHWVHADQPAAFLNALTRELATSAAEGVHAS